MVRALLPGLSRVLLLTHTPLARSLSDLSPCSDTPVLPLPSRESALPTPGLSLRSISNDGPSLMGVGEGEP